MSHQAITKLIVEEQTRQAGKLVTGVELEQYIDKLLTQAELVSHCEGQYCLGFIAFYCNRPSTGCAYISLFIVAPACRERGIAGVLLSHVDVTAKTRGFKKIELEVNRNNSRAIHWYDKAGFTVVAEHENAYRMSRPVT